MKKTSGVDAIVGVLGEPKGEEAEESEESGGELETHLRAFKTALNGGRMMDAAEAFRAAVSACQGYDEME